MAWEMDIASRIMSRRIKQDLGIPNNKKGQRLTVALKEQKSRRLLYSKECYKGILFTDENIFTVEESLCKVIIVPL